MNVSAPLLPTDGLATGPDVSTSVVDHSRAPATRKGVLTRARLLAAAKLVFEEDGFFDARISDIASRAEVSHGTFYTYFSSKPEIFREVALAVEDELGSPLGSIILDRSSSAGPRQRIREAIRDYLERYRAQARIISVIEQVSRHDADLMAARSSSHVAARRLVAESIARLHRRGVVDASLDPEIASAVLGSMMDRFPELWLAEGKLDCSFDTGVEQLTAIFMNALRLSDPTDAG